MQNIKILILTLFVGILLIGCAAIGVISTNDPNQKIADAFWLFDEQQRGIPAERLIREAITIYKTNNNTTGLAEAYRAYGFFFRSGAVKKNHIIYKKYGFMDKDATYTNRYEKSIKYFKLATNIFEKMKRYGALTNVYLNMGFTYEFAGMPNKACEEYKKSIIVNEKFIKQNSNAKLNIPQGYSSYKAYMQPFFNRLMCK